ncbi:Serine protease [Phytophthora megakarya]|uniref:Serine protease n=1 Tax=Phytophthora megakarya TaxID=4795 RepID=A0A225V7U5_9STRA|nr:Serine protease [Phytophthora megakarya]
MSKAATLLFAHGGGYCKETWEPIISRLKASSLLQTVNTQFVNFDFKYHGSNRDESVEAKVDLNNPTGPRVHHPASDLTAWTSAEVLQQARALKNSNTALIGIGHSMGASAMWNTEVQYPGTFDGLILFEPVYGKSKPDAVTNFLVSITLQRESSWSSRATAEQHLRNFKNFAAWDRESMDAYLKGALVEDEATGKTVLACSTPIEASLYCHKLLHLNDQQLARPQCKVFFHYGSRTKMFQPPTFKEICEKLPSIYTMENPIADSSHAMVMEKPKESAQNILDNLQEFEPFNEEDQPAVEDVSRL